MPVSKDQFLRAAFSLTGACLITFLGVWAYLASNHDHSAWLIVAQVVALPFAALGSTVQFIDSDFVFWTLLAMEFLLWSSGIFVLLSVVRRQRDRTSVA